MATQSELSVLGSTQIAIGLSQVLKVIPSAYQFAQTIKIGSGGGTLEIVPPQLNGASTASGSAWGKGYALGGTEVFNFGGPAIFYLAATGATMTAWMTIGYTSGASTP